jgi:hypothetical protein
MGQKQEWVMENCPVGARWDIMSLIDQLGDYEYLEYNGSRAKHAFSCYYFPSADMTIFHNKLKGTVATYTWGKMNSW